MTSSFNAEEPYLPSLGAGCQAECGGQTRLPRAGRPDEQDVLSAIVILALHEFEDLGLIDTWPGREVECIEHLGGREPCRLPLALDQFQLDELQQGREMVGIVGSTPLGDLLGLRQRRERLQGLEVVRSAPISLGP